MLIPHVVPNDLVSVIEADLLNSGLPGRRMRWIEARIIPARYVDHWLGGPTHNNFHVIPLGMVAIGLRMQAVGPNGHVARVLSFSPLTEIPNADDDDPAVSWLTVFVTQLLWKESTGILPIFI